MGINMKKDEIIKKLRGADGYISGQELCECFGVSRTAVWKAVKQLEKDGYKIEAVNNRGYRLIEDAESDILSQAAIESYIETKWAAKNLIFKKETGSTNIDAKSLGENGAVSGTLVVADRQTAGLGRRGRSWVSEAGENIYMSIMLRPDCRPEKASMLTLVMALAALEAVNELQTETARALIKWPNDIVINGKKVCGILTEMSAELDGIHYVVTGIGINSNQTRFDGEIADRATSIFNETGRKVNRAKLIGRTMHYLEKYYAEFEKSQDMSRLMERYNSFLANMDEKVRVLDPKGEYDGTARGINEKGELIVDRADGGREYVFAGEVSVRGVYGYV